MNQLRAGAASTDISPTDSLHLSGYPHAPRLSTGVHDPLRTSALYLENDGQRVLFIANDVIYISKHLVSRARDAISRQTGIPPTHIMISATHTHSGPKMLDPIATSGDKAVPQTNANYVARVTDAIIQTALQAAADARPAEAGLAEADATGIGTNRRDPGGPHDLTVPVLIVRDAQTHKAMSAMLVCCMHPTVLHEDSTLVSGDFPGLARLYVQQHFLGDDCPVLHHTGPAGNQSPRHVTRANTFDEARRLGEILGGAVVRAAESIDYHRDLPIKAAVAEFEIPLREFATEAEARQALERAVTRLETLRKSDAPRTQIRTAETDWFGAEETLTLARAKASGELERAAQSAMPAEVQAIRVGPWTFVAWPGEMFVEFGLALKQRWPNTYPIAYANGELQGYLVTREAAQEGGYESANAVFKSPEGGELLVGTTHRLLERLNA